MINPKNLILDLMLAVGDKPMSARDAILAGSLFGISENSLRVTLARLSAAELIEVAGRGAGAEVSVAPAGPVTSMT